MQGKENVRKTNDENIREKQHQLNNLLAKDEFDKNILDKNILKLSQELDKLIVAHYTKDTKSVN